MEESRRDFLKKGVALGSIVGAITEGSMAEAEEVLEEIQTPKSTRKGEMLYRTLGNTGEQVSLIGLGGFHIGTQKDEKESLTIIRTAVDRGVNFLDNCWDYNEGQSELRMGKALRDGYRDKAFLMTKIDGRTKASAAQQINQSLERLQTDHLDLLQFHEILRFEDPDRVFGVGGAMEAALDAKKAGKVRFIGFTGHKDPLIHLRMLEVAEKHKFHFDAVQMPLNIMDVHFRSFQRQVLPQLVKQKIGVLAMKTFGDHFILDHVLNKQLATPIELLQYSMNLPTSVVITGIDSLPILEQALKAVSTFTPLTSLQVKTLEGKTQTAAMEGTYELFKTTTNFDGTAKKTEWLG